eukprot:4041388-Amphidinium_carterae.2
MPTLTESAAGMLWSEDAVSPAQVAHYPGSTLTNQNIAPCTVQQEQKRSCLSPYGPEPMRTVGIGCTNRGCDMFRLRCAELPSNWTVGNVSNC